MQWCTTVRRMLRPGSRESVRTQESVAERTLPASLSPRWRGMKSSLASRRSPSGPSWPCPGPNRAGTPSHAGRQSCIPRPTDQMEFPDGIQRFLVSSVTLAGECPDSERPRAVFGFCSKLAHCCAGLRAHVRLLSTGCDPRFPPVPARRGGRIGVELAPWLIWS